MKILVTGSNGFVGHWMCRHLESCGDEVIALDPSIDINDENAIEQSLTKAKPEAIIHLAAWADVGSSWQNQAKVFAINAQGTLTLLAATQQLSEAPKVLIVSSAEVYGKLTESECPVSESAELRPVSPYAVSKVSAEFLGLQAHLASGLPVIRVRPFNHIGPGQRTSFVVAALAERIVKAIRSNEKELPIGNMTPRRDFTDVRDVVRAYRKLLDSGKAGDVYNVCSGEAISIGEVAERMIKLANASLVLKEDDELTRPVDVPLFLGDNTKLTKTTGWKREHALDDSMQDVLNYWKETTP
jgi:GDP-4-dehydro-6-deoxy-D-mannose reductase